MALRAPLKLQCFIWSACKGNLAMKKRLVHRHVTEDETCQVCGAGNETIIHALFHCEAAAEIWRHSNLVNLLVGALADSFKKIWN
uniref:Reverse transcriptase zinc-binding domain-containing protein n=1 Tax=Chenopodium quinoa TaxID=63459 RepID=A0A803MUD6_CHEQI